MQRISEQMKERGVTWFLAIMTVAAIFLVGRAVWGWATKPPPYPPVNVRLVR